MNRTLTNVLFGGIGNTAAQSDYKIEGQITKTSVEETVDALQNAESVILVSHNMLPLTSYLRPLSRSWVMAWLSPKPSTRLQKLSVCSGPRASRYGLRSIPWLEGRCICSTARSRSDWCLQDARTVQRTARRSIRALRQYVDVIS